MFPNCIDEMIYRRTGHAVPLLFDLFNNTTCCPNHKHNFIEFTYVTAGEGTETVNGITHCFKKGTFTLLLPYHVHELKASPGNTLTFYIAGISLEAFFDPLVTDPGVHQILLTSDPSLNHVCFEGKEAVKMEQVMESLMEEFQSGDHYNKLMLKSKLTECIILFDRERRKQFGESMEQSNNHCKPIWKIIQYIHTNYRSDISLKTIEEKFCLSSSNISKLFTRYLSTRFIDFLHELRITHACSLLSSSEMNVIDICFEVGFSSYVTFSRVFKKVMGVSAYAYRQKMLNR